MPQDILDAASQRLGWAALLYAGTYAVAFLIDRFSRAHPSIDSSVTDAIGISSILSSVAVWWIVRNRFFNPSRLLNLGLVYWVVGALGIDLPRYYLNFVLGANLDNAGLSWVCVWLVVFPLVVPSSSGKVLIAALATASMGPLSFLVVSRMFVPPQGDYSPVHLFFPYYVSSALAFVSSRIVYQLGRDVREAREMGSYRLVKNLGKGGMGEVWLANHRMLARPAAVKFIRPEIFGHRGRDDTILVRRFEREAQATASLSSPHTVEIYDFGLTDDGRFYYAMEFLKGLGTDQLVHQYGPLNSGRVIYLLKQACDSLNDAHSCGIVHRDIKPGNIYLCQLGCHYDFVKVLDFGLVRYQGGRSRDQTVLTNAGVITGTPTFAAPEIAMEEESVDGRADIYSLGCVAYWLLTGKFVFEGISAMELFLHHIQTPPVPPSERIEAPISPELEAIVMACLKKDPSKRPSSARELLSLLDDCRCLEPWTRERAERWWKEHDPLAGLGFHDSELAEGSPLDPETFATLSLRNEID